jgi:hypothetical protein
MRRSTKEGGVAMQMPASWVSGGFGIPDVCSRHGEPPTRRRRMVIESRAPGWTYATIPAGLLLFWILRAVFRKAIVTPAWPFCDRCRRRRAVAMVIASAIVALGFATMAVGFGSPDSDVVGRMFAAGLVIAMLGYVGFHWATLAAIAGVRLTQDGQHVLLKSPSPTFAALLRTQQPVPGFARPAG